MKSAETIEKEMNEYIKEKFKDVDTIHLTRELQIGPRLTTLDMYERSPPTKVVDSIAEGAEHEGYINTVILNMALIPAEEYHPEASEEWKDAHKGKYVLIGDAIAEERMAAFDD